MSAEHNHGDGTLRDTILRLHRQELDGPEQHLLAHVLDLIVPRPLLDIDWSQASMILIAIQRPEAVLTRESMAEDGEFNDAKRAAQRGEGGIC